VVAEVALVVQAAVVEELAEQVEVAVVELAAQVEWAVVESAESVVALVV